MNCYPTLLWVCERTSTAMTKKYYEAKTLQMTTPRSVTAKEPYAMPPKWTRIGLGLECTNLYKISFSEDFMVQ